jgi:uncharacterized YigZ family protein
MDSIIDTYRSIETHSFAEFKDRSSKFLAYAYYMDEEEQLDDFLAALKSEHPKARHFCFAYKLGLDDNRFRINDDGEPSGTAGKPIYGQLLSHEITNVIIIVIRYFGGTKLGASGLIHAYKESAKLAIENNNIINYYLYKDYVLDFDYEHMGQVLDVLKDLDLEIKDKQFLTSCTVHICIRLSLAEQVLIEFKARMLNVSYEEVTESTEIPFCKIEESTSK